jgi:hypothetical protein
MKGLMLTGLLGLVGSAAAAQDGAMDMTGMGIYSQEDAVMEAAGKPNSAAAARAASSRKAKADCARVAEFRRQLGARDPLVQKATALCRKLGHPTG